MPSSLQDKLPLNGCRREGSEHVVSSPEGAYRTSELQQLIKKRARVTAACAVIFAVSFAAVVALSLTDLRTTYPVLLWSLYAVALISLGAGVVVGTQAAGLVRVRRRIEKGAQFQGGG